MEKTAPDIFLFGTDLGEKLKVAKSMEKMGTDLLVQQQSKEQSISTIAEGSRTRSAMESGKDSTGECSSQSVEVKRKAGGLTNYLDASKELTKDSVILSCING